MSTDDDLSAMSLDELWGVHEKISQMLFERLIAQQRQLDAKLAVLQRRLSVAAAGADDPRSTKASRRPAASKLIKKSDGQAKPDGRAAKPMAVEKTES